MLRALPVIICALALIGLADSVYLTVVQYRAGGVDMPRADQVCDIRAGNCETAFQSPESTTFGVPNCLLGVLYFTLVLAATVFRIASARWPAMYLYLPVLAVGLAYSGYMLRELADLNVACPFCVAAHSANVLIVALTLMSMSRDLRNRWAVRADRSVVA